jgi:hypothetical protein
MANRGVHFALTDDQSQALLAAKNDNELMSVIEMIEEEWNDEYLAECDKAWDAIHRCLTDGNLFYESGRYPLNHCICGGQQLYMGEDYTICFISVPQVKDVATAIILITENWFRERYFAIPVDDYGMLSEDDFQYTWEWFQEIRKLYKKASTENRAVIFTVDC